VSSIQSQAEVNDGPDGRAEITIAIGHRRNSQKDHPPGVIVNSIHKVGEDEGRSAKDLLETSIPRTQSKWRRDWHEIFN
jgi:hypothetical protein